MPGDINIVELQGTVGSAPANDRKKGFAEIIAADPRYKIIRSQTGDFTRAKGKEVMEAFLKAEGKKINVLFAHNDDMAIGAIQAIEEAGLKPGTDITIISIDGVKGAFEAMIAGKLNVTVECSPLLGPQLMAAVKDVVAGKPIPKRIVTEESVFPKETAAQVLPDAQVLRLRCFCRRAASSTPTRASGRSTAWTSRLRAGEVHALMGQNGAGKSTLIKVLTGAAPLQAGQISLAGQSIRPTSTQDAQRLGISTVYQEVNLCGNLSVAENIFAGRQPLRRWTRGGGIDWRGLNQRARTLLAGLDVEVDVRRELASLPVAVQQMVAIARAIDISARVLILDEPTSSLDSDEVEKLFSAMKRLRDSGMAILFVTHFLDQVYAVSDRITVLRNGRLVGEYPASALDHAALVAAMVGRTSSGREAAVANGTPAAPIPAISRPC